MNDKKRMSVTQELAALLLADEEAGIRALAEECRRYGVYSLREFWHEYREEGCGSTLAEAEDFVSVALEGDI